MRKLLIAVLFVVSANSAFAQKEKLGSPDLPGDLIINVGINALVDRPRELRLNAFGSKSVGIYYTNRVAISPTFSFYPALGLGLEKYDFQDDITLTNNATNETQITDISGLGVISKNRLATTFLEAPVEFRYFPKKTTDGSGFFIAIGGSIGIRLASHMKLKYTTEEDVNVTDKFRTDYNQSTVRYGLIGRIGTRGVSGFYRVYFSQVFDDGQVPNGLANPTSYTLGISFNAF